MDPQITTAVIAASAAILAALGAQVVGALATAKREKDRMIWDRRRWEAEQAAARDRWHAEQAAAQRSRHLEDRKLIADDILAGIAALREYQNDHFPSGVPDQLTDKAELLGIYRTLSRAHRRGTLYFSPETTRLVVEELRYWRDRIDLLDEPGPDQRLKGFRLTAARAKSGRQEELEAALQREVWSD